MKNTIVLAFLLVAMLSGSFLASSEVKSLKVLAKGNIVYPPCATKAEQGALDNLAAEIKGALVYTREGRVRKVVIGKWMPTDLGEGEFVRWGPDGKKIAVYYKGIIYVMNADGTNRKKLVSVGGKVKHCPIEFHANGEEIIYVTPSKELWAVQITDGMKENLGVSGKYNGEPGISADGRRLVARCDHNLYAIDLCTGQIRKYDWGCSSGISPDGNWLMNNAGNHREMVIRSWEGQKKIKIDSKTCQPDESWDNHHWSNNNNYIAVQGSGEFREAYVFNVFKNHGTRLIWEGDALYPDLFVANENGTAQ